MAVFDSQAGEVTASITRPANTTAYAANDAVSDSTSAPSAMTFSNCGRRPGGTGYVMDVCVVDSANQSTLPQLELYIFQGSSAPTATNDNSEFGLTDANALNCIGVFKLLNFDDLDVTSGTAGNAFCRAVLDQPVPFKCSSTVKNLYGLVKVVNAYTPVSGEIFTFRLGLEQD